MQGRALCSVWPTLLRLDAASLQRTSLLGGSLPSAANLHTLLACSSTDPPDSVPLSSFGARYCSSLVRSMQPQINLSSQLCSVTTPALPSLPHSAVRFSGSEQQSGTSQGGCQHHHCSFTTVSGHSRQPSPLHVRTPDSTAPAASSLPHSYTTQRSNQAVSAAGDVFVYDGPLAVTVTRLKKLSLFSLACTIGGAPLIIFWGMPGAPVAAQASIALTLYGFGFFTTALLHWFTSPYVHRLTYQKASGLVEVDSLNFFAQPVRDRFHVAEVAYPDTMRPQVTFKAKNKMFYVDADNFGDKQLLDKLTPMDPAAAPQAPDHLPSGKH